MNRTGCLALGVGEGSGFGMPWLPLLPSSIHVAGQDAIEDAHNGRDARFAGQSDFAGETRYWDNMLTPIADDSGNVRVVLCVSRDVTTKILLERELAKSLRREQLLAQEMRHREGNIFAAVSGLISLYERQAVANGAKDAELLAHLREKLVSLAHASNASFNDGDDVDVRLVIGALLQPFSRQCQYEAERFAIPRSSTTLLVLFLHELATNSLKNGAFSSDAGKVRVSCRAGNGDLNLAWVEHGAPAHANLPEARFGTEMVQRLARSVGGSVRQSITQDGLTAVLQLPIY